MHDLTIGDGCRLYLGVEGTSRGTHKYGSPGIYGFDTLTVGAGGEVTMASNVAENQHNMRLIVSALLYVQLS